MKFIDIDKIKYKPDLKRDSLFILLAVIFAVIATIKKFDDMSSVVKIILFSVPITSVILFLYFKIDSYLKVEAKIKKLSFIALFVLAYILPKIIFKTVQSDFVEYLILWVCVEGLAFGFLIEPRLREKRKE
ncbi:MAG: hypothetical protein AB1552_14125 [Nitrospirota bacterium]